MKVDTSIVPDSLISDWPIEYMEMPECTSCNVGTERECGKCAQPVCEDGDCIAEHILKYHKKVLDK